MSNQMLYSQIKNYMFRPVVAIIRFYPSTHLRLFYTIRVAACLMRRPQHQNPCWGHSTSILGVWVSHVIIHKNITLYYQKKNKNKKRRYYKRLPQDGTFMFLVFVSVLIIQGYIFMYYSVAHPHTQYRGTVLQQVF